MFWIVTTILLVTDILNRSSILFTHTLFLFTFTFFIFAHPQNVLNRWCSPVNGVMGVTYSSLSSHPPPLAFSSLYWIDSIFVLLPLVCKRHLFDSTGPFQLHFLWDSNFLHFWSCVQKTTAWIEVCPCLHKDWQTLVVATADDQSLLWLVLLYWTLKHVHCQHQYCLIVDFFSFFFQFSPSFCTHHSDSNYHEKAWVNLTQFHYQSPRPMFCWHHEWPWN